MKSSIERINYLTTNEKLRTCLAECFKNLEADNSPENNLALAECYAKLENESLNEEIAQIYSKVAALGNPVAQNELGKCYQFGTGVEKNMAKALEWYILAANQGLSEAQYNLARLVETNHTDIAFYYLKLASAQHHGDSLYEMGRCYEYGKGVKTDYTTARYYYDMAWGVSDIDELTKKVEPGYWRLKAIVDFFSL